MLSLMHVRINLASTPLPSQKEHQRAVHGPGQRGHSVVGLNRRSRGQFPAGPAESHQHEEDLHYRSGCCQEEESVYPGQTPSGKSRRL